MLEIATKAQSSMKVLDCKYKGIVAVIFGLVLLRLCISGNWTVLSSVSPRHYRNERSRSALSVQEPALFRDSIVLPKDFKLSFPFVTYSVFGGGDVREVLSHYDSRSDHQSNCSARRAVVPNYVHWTWFYGAPAPFKFHHYVCALSAVRIQRPERIYVWHDALPSGVYWQQLLAEAEAVGVALHLKKITAPNRVFNKTISVPEHKSDVQRLLVLIQYGGIYMDLDVVIVKPLTPLMCYDVTLGQETDSKLNNGIILAKRNASFLNIWYDNFKTYDGVWDSHNVKLPFTLWKTHPDLIHVEHTTMNLPNWREDVRYIFSSDLRYDWSHNYCVHTWYRSHGREYNMTSIQGVTSTLGDLFRHVLGVKM